MALEQLSAAHLLDGVVQIGNCMSVIEGVLNCPKLVHMFTQLSYVAYKLEYELFNLAGGLG